MSETIKIYIDGHQAETENKTRVSVTLSVSSLRDPDKTILPYSKSIRLPYTIANRKIMGDCDQIHALEAFNDRQHTAWIEKDGCVVMEGIAYMSECVKGIDPHYKLTITGPGKKWAVDAAATTLRSLDVDFEEMISPAMVAGSWTWDKPVRFLPVRREGFTPQNLSGNIFQPARMLTFADYHPFLHVKSVVEEIFAASGYTVSSGFMKSDFFESLYMSGNFPQKNVDNIRSRMDFRAGRFEDAVAVAGSLGVVETDPYLGSNTLGNIVQTADPKEEKDGQTVEGVYSHSDCFYSVDGRIVFKPLHEVMVSFEYQLYYTTDFYMESRAALRGFDRVNLEDGQLRRFRINNRNTDRRAEFRAGKTYFLIVFDHVEGDEYQFRYDVVTNSSADMSDLQPSDVSTRTHETFSSRTISVTVTGGSAVVNPSLWILDRVNGSYSVYTGDWALYDGYVKERGQIDIELTLRSAAQRIMPSKPKYFNNIYFGGADPGMTLRLRKQTVIRPVFEEYPAEGSTVMFEDLAAHHVSRLGVIKALKHLFCLYFYTDELCKKVYIEPRDSFYRDDVVVDWTDKLDLAKPVKVSEPGYGMAETLTFRYIPGDGAVSAWNVANSDTLGKWSAHIVNSAAKQTESTLENPLFTASLNSRGEFPDAVSAILLNAGDREEDASVDTGKMNFPAKIVRFAGMQQLPSGEKWGWPSNGDSYPLVLFHLPGGQEDSPADGKTLCIEDRDGLSGVGNYWKSTVDAYNRSRTVEAWLILRPADIERFVKPDGDCADFRALYKLKIEGENGLYRLEEISDYDPSSSGSTKCKFIKIT